MSKLLVHAGDFTFEARFEEQLAPKTVRSVPQGDAVREPGHPRALER